MQFPSLRRLILLSLCALIAATALPATASAGFSLPRLRQTNSTGLENYLYTAGNTVYAGGTVDTGSKSYRFVVNDASTLTNYNGASFRQIGACRVSPANGAVSDSYTVKSSDPPSTSVGYRYALLQYNGTTCAGSPAKTKFLYFGVAKATAYTDAGMTFPKSSFQAGATAYVSVAGVADVDTTAGNTAYSTGSWNMTWLQPNLLKACSNTAGGDRPGSTVGGVLPATSSLRYQPTTVGNTWDQYSHYDNGAGGQPCPAFSASNEGQWQLQLKLDATHIVTLPVFTVDTTAPDTSLTGSPSAGAITGINNASFNLHSTEASASFQCSLDSAPYSSCTSPATYTGLSDGPHVFQVRSIDAAGNTDASPAQRIWTLDSTRPAVTLTQPSDDSLLNTPKPAFAGAAGNKVGDSTGVTLNIYAGTSPSGSPVRSFSFTRDGATWSLPANLWDANSASRAPLTDGTYTAVALQSDTAIPPNTAVSGEATFKIDTTAPLPTLSAPVNNLTTADGGPLVTGSAGTGSGDGSNVTVNVYSGTAATGTPFQTFTAPVSASGSWSGRATLGADGKYTIQAVQADNAGNNGKSATHVITLDTQAPTTSLTGGPEGPTGSTTATFTFNANEPATFQCQLDNYPATRCSSAKSYYGLAAGAHTFTVTAVDAAGNEGNQVTSTWTINTALPAVTLVSPASGSSTASTRPTFTGDAGTNAGDANTVTVKVKKQGTGEAVESVSAPVAADGSWSVQSLLALPEGDYVAHAEQAGSAGTAMSFDHVFTVDTTPPVTSLTPMPLTTTSATSASFSFASNEGGSKFQCKLDAGSYVPCSSPKSYSGLASGTHTFRVRAVDTAGNVDPDPASQTWAINTSLPSVSITAPADGSSVATGSPVLSGTAATGTGTSSTVSVKVYSLTSGQPNQLVTTLSAVRASNSGAWSVAPSPALSEGTYTAYATQDGPGGTGMSAARTFTVDLSPPTTTIKFGTQGTTSSTTASFTFSSSEPGTTFECNLDASGWTACSSPQSYSNLAVGSHSFLVRGVDAAGNPDPTPDEAQWTVDTSASALTPAITTPGAGSFVNTTTPTISGTSSANTAAGVAGGVTVEIIDPDTGADVAVLDPATVSGAGHTWSASTASSPLPEGTWVAYAEQDNANGDIFYSAPVTFTVDMTAPEPALDVPAAGMLTNDPAVGLSGTAGTAPGDAGTVTVNIYSAAGALLQTQVANVASDGTFVAHPSPALAEGTYKVRASQSDSAGNTSYTGRFPFTIDTTAPSATVDSGPDKATPTTATGAQFSFSTSEAGSTFECSLDGAAFSACTSPQAFSSLAAGDHNFAVRATDAAGNTGAASAKWIWTITAPAPVSDTQPAQDTPPADTPPPATSEPVAAAPLPAPAAPAASAPAEPVDQVTLALRIGGCDLKVSMKRKTSVAGMKGRVRVGLVSKQNCTITTSASAKPGKRGRAATTRGVKKNLKAGKRVTVTLSFDKKSRTALAAALKKAPKGLQLTLSFKGAAGKLKPVGKTARVLLVR